MSSLIPVALFAYSRPNLLKQTLEGLRKNDVPLIYAFIDGPKDDSKRESVDEVKRILHSVNWCNIRIIERSSNIGLGSSIRRGVSEVFEEFEKIIIVEDDIVLRSGAYNYTCEALNYFEKSEKVMSVSMWTSPFISKGLNPNGFFSNRFVCWGWGTYKKYWIKYTEKPIELFSKAQKLNIDLLIWGKDIKDQAILAEERNLWYVGYLIQHFIENKISYFPQQSLTVNIGKDGSGENINTGHVQDDITLLSVPVRSPVEWPEPETNYKIASRFARYFENRTGNQLIYIVKYLIVKIYKKTTSIYGARFY
jgi:hypothetical protein